MKSHVNHPVATMFGWIICLLMVVAGVATIASLIL